MDPVTFFHSLTTKQITSLAFARQHDIFASVARNDCTRHQQHNDELLNWWLRKVEKHEGSIPWAIARVNQLIHEGLCKMAGVSGKVPFDILTDALLDAGLIEHE